MEDNYRKPWFKSYDSKLNDMRFVGLSNTDWGIFHKLENHVNLQPERGVIRLSPDIFCQVLAKRLDVRKNRLDKYLTKFKERGLLDYSIEEGWLDFIYFKEQQRPLSDAERQRRYREKKKSRQRDENVTEGVTHKKRKDNTIQENSSVTAPPPGEDGGAGQLPTKEQMISWLRDIDKYGSSLGMRIMIDQFQTMFPRLKKAEREEIAKLAADEGLELPP